MGSLVDSNDPHEDPSDEVEENDQHDFGRIHQTDFASEG